MVGEDVADVNAARCELLNLKSCKISGRVTQMGAPVEGAELTAYKIGGVNRDKTVLTHWRTRADGTYSGTIQADRLNIAANLPNAPYPGNGTSPPTA